MLALPPQWELRDNWLRDHRVLVQTSSEIPLPSPLYHSSSGLGPVAIGHQRHLPRWCCGLSPFRVQGVALCHMTLELHSNQKPRDIDQLGSLAGAARLLHHNAGVLKQCSDGTEISRGGAGHRCC